MHIFFICSKAIECWDKIGIGNIICELLPGANNFFTMLFDLFTRLKEQEKLVVTMTPGACGRVETQSFRMQMIIQPPPSLSELKMYYMN